MNNLQKIKEFNLMTSLGLSWSKKILERVDYDLDKAYEYVDFNGIVSELKKIKSEDYKSFILENNTVLSNDGNVVFELENKDNTLGVCFHNNDKSFLAIEFKGNINQDLASAIATLAYQNSAKINRLNEEFEYLKIKIQNQIDINDFNTQALKKLGIKPQSLPNELIGLEGLLLKEALVEKVGDDFKIKEKPEMVKTKQLKGKLNKIISNTYLEKMKFNKDRVNLENIDFSKTIEEILKENNTTILRFLKIEVK